MKRRACKRLLTAAVLCAALTVPAKAAQRSVPVQIDGKPIAVSAYVERGVTYVPLRALLNTMGDWDIWWDEATGRAAAASDDTHLWADPAADTVTVDEKTVRGRVTVENGVTYVPLRLVGEALGCQVEWDPYLRGATVGNVILNRVRSGSFPNTVEGVIFDRKDAVQFEPVSNGRVYLPPTSQSVEAAKRALDGENVVGSALYFYAPALSQGTWINANRPYQQTIGCHRFYR